MRVEELKSAVMALPSEEKKTFILEALPDLAGEVINEPGFMMQLFPVLLGILKESGMDLQQLLQFATMMGDQQKQE